MTQNKRASIEEAFLTKAKLAILKKRISLKYLAREEGYGLFKFETTAYRTGSLTTDTVECVRDIFDRYATCEDKRRIACMSQLDSVTFAKYYNRTICCEEFRSLLRYFCSLSENDIDNLLDTNTQLHRGRNCFKPKQNNISVPSPKERPANFGLGVGLVAQITNFIRQQNAKKTDL